jgi:sorbitol/mannitol transport system substrate-binding protein
MKKFHLFTVCALIFILLGTWALFAGGTKEGEKEAEKKPVTVTIATVNNPDMKVMQELSPIFTEKTGINLDWVVLPENELRQKVTEDVSLGAGKFDIVTIGIIEVKNWVNYEWIRSLDPLLERMDAEEKQEYDLDDVLESVREGLSVDGKLYALPFYGETSMVYYRKDLFEEAGLTMPEEPTWSQIFEFAKKLHDPANGMYGLVLRGLPGWGENMAVFCTMINAFGGRWYDMDWNAQFDTQEVRDAFEMYYKLIKNVCEPGATGVGFTEGLTLMAQGKGAIWYDATVGAGLLNDPKQSKVAGRLGYARAPWEKKHNNGWLWAWSLAIESASKHADEALEFMTWATSKDYINLVGEERGWVNVPSGSRESTYKNSKYMNVADFAPIVLSGMKAVDYNNPTLEPAPYIGTPFVVIPEWPHLGTEVGQILAAYISDKISLDEAIKQCDDIANNVAIEGGYRK